MKGLATWWLFYALRWVVLYGAFAMHIEGALYTLKFLVWLMALASPLLLFDKAIATTAKKPQRPVRNALWWLQAVATLFSLVWFGHIASAVAACFLMLMVAVHRTAVLMEQRKGQS